MSDNEFVSKSEFMKFAKTHAEDMQMIKDMLRPPTNSPNLPTKSSSYLSTPANISSIPTAASAFTSFAGCLPHPLGGRSSNQSSFVNVGAALKQGIDDYNAKQPDGSPHIITDEFDGSLLKWSRQAFSTLDTILGKYVGLNAALGQSSLERAQHLSVFSNSRTGRFNRERSGAIEDLKRAFPVLCLARANWAANELLRNKFSNAKSKAAKMLRNDKAFNEKETFPRRMKSKALTLSDTDEIESGVVDPWMRAVRKPVSNKTAARSSVVQKKQVGNPQKKLTIKKTILKNDDRGGRSTRAVPRQKKNQHRTAVEDMSQEVSPNQSRERANKSQKEAPSGRKAKSGNKFVSWKQRQQNIAGQSKLGSTAKNSSKKVKLVKVNKFEGRRKITHKHSKAGMRNRLNVQQSDDEYSDQENIPGMSIVQGGNSDDRPGQIEEEQCFTEESGELDSNLTQEKEEGSYLMESEDESA